MYHHTPYDEVVHPSGLTLVIRNDPSKNLVQLSYSVHTFQGDSYLNFRCQWWFGRVTEQAGASKWFLWRLVPMILLYWIGHHNDPIVDIKLPSFKLWNKQAWFGIGVLDGALCRQW